MRAQQQENSTGSLLFAALCELAEVVWENSFRYWEWKKDTELTNTANTQAQNQGYEFPTKTFTESMNLEHLKGTSLQIEISQISLTQDNSRLAKRSPTDSSLSVM